MTGGKKINDLENMSTEISQTERKKKKTPLQRYTFANCRKPKMKRKILKGKEPDQKNTLTTEEQE